MLEKQQAPVGERGAMIRLVGRLHQPRSTFAGRFGDIGAFIERHGYDAYAGENVEMYCSLPREATCAGVVALFSGFMTYGDGVHPEYRRVRRELEQSAQTFVLLPSLDRERCVAETG